MKYPKPFKNNNTYIIIAMNTQEKQYIDLIEHVLNNGHKENTRNGSTLSIFGHMMRFSLKDNKIPFMTHKKLAWKTCIHELLFFIRGLTNNDWLNNRGVNIWNKNATREFLDKRGLNDYKINELGPVYGFQWRNFNGNYQFSPINDESDPDPDPQSNPNSGIDQLKYIIDQLSDKTGEGRKSRRLIMTAWNPCQLNKMVLPPCHVLCQFNVYDNKLSCALYQRSGDLGLGVPFNIASYSVLTHLLAYHCNLIADEFVYFLGNAHIYEEHIESLKNISQRKIYSFPTLTLSSKKEKIEEYDIEDFIISNYNYDDTPLILNMIA